MPAPENGSGGASSTGGTGGHNATGGRVGSGGSPGAGGGTPASGGTVGTSSGGSPGAAGKVGGGGQGSPGTGGGGAAGMNAGQGGAPKGGAGGGTNPAGGMSGAAGSPAAGGAGGAVACGPKTCATGCCDGDRCVTTHASDKCGANGAACTKCNSCFRCGNAGTCEVDPMSTWKIVCVSATLSSTKTNFQSWDSMSGPGGGPIGGGGPGSNGTDLLPDPVCQLSVGLADTVVGTTSVLDNTTTPRWNEAITSAFSPLTAAQLMSQSTPWAISVQDDDGRERPELACRLTPQLAASDFVSTDVNFDNVQSCLTLNIHLACQSP